MSLLLIVIFIIFGVAAGEPQAVETSRVCVQDLQGNCLPEPADGWVPVSFDGFEGVIVPAAAAVGNGWFTNEEAWTPAEEDVLAAEDAIAEAQGPLDHMRQYIGVTEEGQRKIFVNGFCDVSDINWQAELVFVMDGGECYFSATYNVETAELESFSFNGEA